jgi:hypothetical protein
VTKPPARAAGMAVLPVPQGNVENASPERDLGPCNEILGGLDDKVSDLADIPSHPACFHVRFKLGKIGRRGLHIQAPLNGTTIYHSQDIDEGPPSGLTKCPKGQYGDSCISLLLPTIGESSIPWPGREWHSCVRCGTRAADLPRHKQRERRPSEGTGTPFPLASGHPRRSGRSPIANGIPRKEIRGRHQRHKCCGLEHAPACPKSR